MGDPWLYDRGGGHFGASFFGGSELLARMTPLFVSGLQLLPRLKFAIGIRKGMVSCAAPTKSPSLLLSVRYRVTSASGEHPEVTEEVISP